MFPSVPLHYDSTRSQNHGGHSNDLPQSSQMKNPRQKRVRDDGSEIYGAMAENSWESSIWNVEYTSLGLLCDKLACLQDALRVYNSKRAKVFFETRSPEFEEELERLKRTTEKKKRTKIKKERKQRTRRERKRGEERSERDREREREN